MATTKIFKYWIFDHPFDGGPIGPYQTSDEAFGELYSLGLAECGCTVRMATIDELIKIHPEIWGKSELVFHPDNGIVRPEGCGRCYFCEGEQTFNCMNLSLIVTDQKTGEIYEVTN